MTTADSRYNLKVPQDLRTQAEKLCARAIGPVRPTHSQLLLEALRRGLVSIEREMGGKRVKKH